MHFACNGCVDALPLNSISVYVEQQKETGCSRNGSQEKEAERRVASETSEGCCFVQKGVHVIRNIQEYLC